MTPLMRLITISDPAAVAAVRDEQARRGIRTAARAASTLLVEYCAELRAMRRGAGVTPLAPVQDASTHEPSAEPPVGGATQLTGAESPEEAVSSGFPGDEAQVLGEPRPRRRSGYRAAQPKAAARSKREHAA